jgi:hypothetical protein
VQGIKILHKLLACLFKKGGKNHCGGKNGGNKKISKNILFV